MLYVTQILERVRLLVLRINDDELFHGIWLGKQIPGVAAYTRAVVARQKWAQFLFLFLHTFISIKSYNIARDLACGAAEK